MIQGNEQCDPLAVPTGCPTNTKAVLQRRMSVPGQSLINVACGSSTPAGSQSAIACDSQTGRFTSVEPADAVDHLERSRGSIAVYMNRGGAE